MKTEGRPPIDADGDGYQRILRNNFDDFGVRRFVGASGQRDLSRHTGQQVARQKSIDEAPHSKGLATVVMFLLALFAVSPPYSADIPSGWNTNLTAALNSPSNRPVLLYFTASWCGPCKLMQANTLPEDTVQSNLTHFACVALDLDANPATAQRYGVSGIPAFLVLTATGDEILRTEGYQDAAKFNAWLDKAKLAFASAQEKVVVFLKQQAALDVNLKSADAAVRQVALTGLLNLCADREPSHQAYATAQLKEFVARDPQELVAGLQHPKLATRIAVANQLRERLASDFDFDPWASAAERAKAVAAVRNRQFPGAVKGAHPERPE